VSVANVLGITGRPTLPFNILNDFDRNNINNLGVTVNANGEITIPADGFYRINPSVKTSSAGGLSVGNAATIISLQALYANASETDGKKFMKTAFCFTDFW
jgi:protein involved in polysaccharide export with SLBB domain